MKVLLDGLAQDTEAGFWLPHLLHTPQIVRLFPFDFAYLDEDLKIINAVELPPEVPLPRFDPRATSALILPLNSLASSGTTEGDLILVCRGDELELRLREIAPSTKIARSSVIASVPPPDASRTIPLAPISQPAPVPFSSPAMSLPIPAVAVPHRSPSTFAMTSSWQISNTTTAAVLLEPLETREMETPTEGADIAVAEVDSAETRVEEAAIEPHASSDTDGVEISNEEETGKRLAIIEVAAPEVESEESQEEPVAVAESESIILTRLAENGSQGLSVTGDSCAPSAHEPPEESDEIHEESILAEIIRSEAIPVIPPEDQAAPVHAVPTEVRIARSREAAERAPKTVPSTAHTAPSAPKKKTREKKKDPLGTRVIRWLNLDDPLPERRKIIRLLLEGLQASETSSDGSKRYEVRDLCPSGFYLRTGEEFAADDVLSLVIEKKGATEKDHEHRVSVQARVVRCDEEGVGLEFAFPKGTEFQPWQRVKTKRSDETEADFILRELRLSRALGFLQQLCPGTEEVKHALHDRLSNKRVAAAVEISLKAESALVRNGSMGNMLAHIDVVMRVIENGSWIEDDRIRRMWAGILVSSCCADGQDNSNLFFIDLLAKLTPVHLRIFSFACHRAVEAIAAAASEARLEVYSTAKELMEVADTHSFPRIQQTIGHLSTYGLLEETARASYADLTDKAKTRITPTAMGLKMYAHCNGQRTAR